MRRGAPPPDKETVQRSLNRLGLPLKVKISTRDDDDRLQGFGPENVINRLAASGIHLEQSAEARAFHKEIAGAVAKVFASPWRWLVWALMGFLCPHVARAALPLSPERAGKPPQSVHKSRQADSLAPAQPHPLRHARKLLRPAQVTHRRVG